MRKLSYLIWLFILSAWAFIQYTDAPHSQATATSAGMASMGVYAAIAGFIVLAAFPLITLAYLFNWQDLFKSSHVSNILRGSKLRLFEAILFLIPAIAVALAWFHTIYSANSFIQLLGVVSALPIFVFGIVNLISYLKLSSQSINTMRKVELTFFALPALLITLFFGLCFYNAQISAQQDKVAAKKACEEAFVATVEHQINRQKQHILESANFKNSQYYKNLPNRPMELFLFVSDAAEIDTSESDEMKKDRINLKQAAWSLHIITSIDDAAPELVLTGFSDSEGFIQADLAKYPQVRKALENGKTLRITTQKGSALLQAGKVDSGELLLRAIMDSYVPAKPILNC
jgi:hypothetical protein